MNDSRIPDLSFNATRPMRNAALAVLLALLPTVTAQNEWDLRGDITAVTKAEERAPRSNVQGSFLVQASTGADAAVTVMDSTKIYLQQAKDRRLVSFAALKPGLRVQVRFAGPAAQSYPVRATGAEVVILSQ
jgi:hypothetical protein